MAEVMRHPLDFAALKKGTYISEAELILAVGCEPPTPQWGLSLIGLAERIFEETGIQAKQEGTQLRLMTDPEALIYRQKQEMHGVRKIRKAGLMLQALDRGELSDEEKRSHEAAMLRNAFRRRAIEKADRKFRNQLASPKQKKLTE